MMLLKDVEVLLQLVGRALGGKDAWGVLFL